MKSVPSSPGPDALRRLREFQRSARRLGASPTGRLPPEATATVAVATRARAALSGPHAHVLARLREHSPELANSLEQVLDDVNDEARLTYVGPAGEAREVMRATVHIFAPDDEVRRQPWFKGVKQGDRMNPSQSERLRYAVQIRGGDTRQANDAIDMIDDRIGRLGRDVYQRASASLHATNQRREVRKIVGWVFAVLDEVLPE